VFAVGELGVPSQEAEGLAVRKKRTTPHGHSLTNLAASHFLSGEIARLVNALKGSRGRVTWPPKESGSADQRYEVDLFSGVHA
jgi:hypothetical protein